jgi:hypothetical protein
VREEKRHGRGKKGKKQRGEGAIRKGKKGGTMTRASGK